MSFTAGRKRRFVNKSSDVVATFEDGHSLVQFFFIEIWLHKRNLETRNRMTKEYSWADAYAVEANVYINFYVHMRVASTKRD